MCFEVSFRLQDAFILSRKYQVKAKSARWWTLTCSAAIAYWNYFFPAIQCDSFYHNRCLYILSVDNSVIEWRILYPFTCLVLMTSRVSVMYEIKSKYPISPLNLKSYNSPNKANFFSFHFYYVRIRSIFGWLSTKNEYKSVHHFYHSKPEPKI